jgi:chaperonin GroES
MGWTKIRPYGNRILVKLDKRQEKVEGTTLDLVIPDRYREQPTTALVIAVGRPLPDADGTVRPIGVEVGQRVAVGKWNGKPVEPPDHDPTGEYFVLNMDGLTLGPVNEDEVLGVVEDG